MNHEKINPAQPKVTLKLGSETYQLVFTFRALAVAEAELKKNGEQINIFHSLDFTNINATSMVALLYASMITEQPEVKIEVIPSLITIKRIPEIRQALFDAFVLAMAEPDENADPLAEEQPEAK